MLGFHDRIAPTTDESKGADAMRGLRIVAAVVLAVLPAATQASETITYTYDTRGRLVQVDQSGTVNAGTSSQYEYDNADNRSHVTVTGAFLSSSSGSTGSDSLGVGGVVDASSFPIDPN